MHYEKKKLYKGYMIQDFFLIHQATSFVLPLGVLFWSLSWWWQYASRNPEEHQTINYRFTPTEQTPEIQMKARYELENGRHLSGRRNIKEVIYKKKLSGWNYRIILKSKSWELYNPNSVPKPLSCPSLKYNGKTGGGCLRFSDTGTWEKWFVWLYYQISIPGGHLLTFLYLSLLLLKPPWLLKYSLNGQSTKLKTKLQIMSKKLSGWRLP